MVATPERRDVPARRVRSDRSGRGPQPHRRQPERTSGSVRLPKRVSATVSNLRLGVLWGEPVRTGMLDFMG